MPNTQELFSDQALPNGRFAISPEKEVERNWKPDWFATRRFAGYGFAEGRVQLVVVKAEKGGALIDQASSFLKEHMPIHSNT